MIFTHTPLIIQSLAARRIIGHILVAALVLSGSAFSRKHGPLHASESRERYRRRVQVDERKKSACFRKSLSLSLSRRATCTIRMSDDAPVCVSEKEGEIVRAKPLCRWGSRRFVERFRFQPVWQDREIRFDTPQSHLANRKGEAVIDQINSVEDTKGENRRHYESIDLESRWILRVCRRRVSTGGRSRARTTRACPMALQNTYPSSKSEKLETRPSIRVGDETRIDTVVGDRQQWRPRLARREQPPHHAASTR